MTQALALVYQAGIKVHNVKEPFNMQERLFIVAQNDIGAVVVAPRDLKITARFKHSASRQEYLVFLGRWVRREGAILSYWIRMTSQRKTA